MKNVYDSNLEVEAIAQCSHWLRQANIQGEAALDAMRHPLIESEIVRRLKWIQEFRNNANCNSLQTTRAIMGKNFFGPEEFSFVFGIADFTHTLEVPFTERTLHQCSDTHVLIAIPEYFSTRMLFSACEIGENSKCLNQNMDSDDFYDEICSAPFEVSDWFLIRKQPIAATRHKSFEEQVQLLPKDEEVASARNAFCMLLMHRVIMGCSAFPNANLRTSTMRRKGEIEERIHVLDHSGVGWWSTEDEGPMVLDPHMDGAYLISCRKYDEV